MKRIIALLIVTAVGAGCVSNQRYPDTWAAKTRVESGQCPAIDGEYRNAGEGNYEHAADGPPPAPSSLAHRLNIWGEVEGVVEKFTDEDRLGTTHYDATQDEFQTVRLRYADQKLHIDALRADGSSRSFALLTRGQCRDSSLMLRPSWEGSTFTFILNYATRDTIAFSRAEDGSLIVRSGSSAGFFVLEWPILFGADSYWTRFTPIPPEDTPVPAAQAAPASGETP